MWYEYYGIVTRKDVATAQIYYFYSNIQQFFIIVKKILLSIEYALLGMF